MARSEVVAFVCGLVVLSAACQATAAETKKQDECTDELVELIATGCNQLGANNGLASLDEFLDFHKLYTKFHANCLQRRSLALKVSERSESIEQTCQERGYLFDQARPLAHLIDRMLVQRDPVCTLEFALKLYHFHQSQRLAASEAGSLVGRTHRLLANSVAFKCRSSLARRLAEVERRAPDSVKFVQLINTVTKVSLAKYKPLDAELFVPVLQRELTESLFDASLSSVGRTGFEFRASSQVVKIGLSSLRVSCNSLRIYHVNLFGSLGLLASLGYASPLKAHRFKWRNQTEANERQTTPADTRAELAQIQRWLVSAFVCQALRNVVKLSSVSGPDGKALTRVKVLQTQEADVAAEEESDATFADFQLTEADQPDAPAPPANQFVAPLAEFKLPAAERLYQRKLQLINGPNYKLASAIYNFLDLSQPRNRLEIVETLLGDKLLEERDDGAARGVANGGEDEQDEEEDDEEEE